MPKAKKAPAAKKTNESALKGEDTPSANGRPVLYDRVSVVLHRDTTALTVAEAKELLGWEEDPTGKSFGPNFALKDLAGTKVRCNNNPSNRPYYSSNMTALKQEILNKRWNFNGEPIIIGKTGLVHNGQHTLIALILAEQERTLEAGELNEHWRTIWGDHPITIDKLLVFGIEETDEVVNTIDTAKPRSLTDVIYRSEYFAAMKESERRIASRMTEQAIKIIWHRTGQGLGFAPLRTHSEALDFLSRHPRILKAVVHVQQENSKGKIGMYISPGYAVGLLYLMAASRESEEALAEYKKSTAGEAALTLSDWDRACDFWALLAGQGKDLSDVRSAVGFLIGNDAEGLGGTLAEKVCIFSQAWAVFVEGQRPTAEDLKLEYHVDEEDGTRRLVSGSSFGGIDLGESPEPAEKIPDEDEVEARKAAVDAARRANTNEGKAKETPKPAAKKEPKKPAVEALKSTEEAAEVAPPNPTGKTLAKAPRPKPKQAG